MNLKTTVLEAIQSQYREIFGEQFQLEVPLAKYTSARVGGPAEMFLTVENTLELQTAVELAYAHHLDYFILGGGSNILISDQGVDGLVIMNRAKNVRFRHTGAHVVCTVESGMNFSSLARQCIGKGLGGLEWAVGIPGAIGGAVVANAGEHGSDMDSILLAANIWEPGRGARLYSNEQLKYEYRSSVLKREQGRNLARRVVLSAELQLAPEAVDILSGRAAGFTAYRKQTQPGGASMGSMFKNPPNYYAGYLIDTAGLKGFQVGNVRISDKHANFFVSDGEATAEDIRSLIAEAWNTVREQFGVELDLEVELVGNWNFE